MHEAVLYDKFPGRKVRCRICQRRCVIPEGGQGFCGTRQNRDGMLFSLAYGRVSFMSVAPIEKKPLYHFYPGSSAMSFGTLGCNFRCPGCQNWDISHAIMAPEDGGAKLSPPEDIAGAGIAPEDGGAKLSPPEGAAGAGIATEDGAEKCISPGDMAPAGMDYQARITEYVSPEESIKLAVRHHCRGMSWTYNEPAVWFEYTLDGARLAKNKKLYTTYVTNGYMTREALDMIGPCLDAFRVDIKGFSKNVYKSVANVSEFAGILDVTRAAADRWGMWVEIVTNIIPGYNDDDGTLKKIASWIVTGLGRDTPWHVTRFVPHLKLSNLEPTPVATLERASRIGQDAGLRYVYIGNIPGHPGQNTYCHCCDELLIERRNFGPVRNRLAPGGRCPNCGEDIPGRF